MFQTPCCILYNLNMTTDAFKLFVIETDGYLNVFAKFQYNGKCPGKFLQYKQWKSKQHKFSMEIEFYFNGDRKIILVCVYRINVFFVFLGSF